MRQFLLKNLLLSSLVTALICSCKAPTAGYKLMGNARISESNILPVIPKEGSLLYKAKIDVYNKHYSGLILLKQTDSSVAHLTFVTEVGMKMFDFEIQNHQLKPVYVFEPLNKEKLIKLLTADFSLILLQNAYGKEAQTYMNTDKSMYEVEENENWYFYVNPNRTISTITEKGDLGIKSITTYSYKEKMEADEILLKHKGFFPLKIKLQAITEEKP